MWGLFLSTTLVMLLVIVALMECNVNTENCLTRKASLTFILHLSMLRTPFYSSFLILDFPVK